MEFVQRVAFSKSSLVSSLRAGSCRGEALGLSAEPSNHFFYVVRQVTFWLFAAAVVFWPEGRRVERDEGRG